MLKNFLEETFSNSLGGGLKSLGVSSFVTVYTWSS